MIVRKNIHLYCLFLLVFLFEFKSTKIIYDLFMYINK